MTKRKAAAPKPKVVSKAKRKAVPKRKAAAQAKPRKKAQKTKSLSARVEVLEQWARTMGEMFDEDIAIRENSGELRQILGDEPG
jgi:hypothetical protein